MQGSRGTSSTQRMSGHASRLMRLESSLFILPELLQQRSSEFGGLELQGFIGQGSFGRVYKGALRLKAHSRQLRASSKAHGRIIEFTYNIQYCNIGCIQQVHLLLPILQYLL